MKFIGPRFISRKCMFWYVSDIERVALKLYMTQFQIKGGSLVHRRDIFNVSRTT